MTAKHESGKRTARSRSERDQELRSSSEIVSGLICRSLGVSAERVSAAAFLVDDLGADSLTLVELALALEERFGITIANEHVATLRTVGDVIAYVDASSPKRAG